MGRTSLGSRTRFGTSNQACNNGEKELCPARSNAQIKRPKKDERSKLYYGEFSRMGILLEEELGFRRT
ncbi:hypothetical protein KIN20_021405 [Parelaphostrongylus tenuis]|uniref:Uncharacterized protein n=1 Tax=Parelaphostrongylus tenuis TaxID=148309 RepID=A0AAD5N7W6_PARTN|nr:hypothetical protein KIN20_021405 [Parelaphostrongylus tenuis]